MTATEPERFPATLPDGTPLIYDDLYDEDGVLIEYDEDGVLIEEPADG